MLHRSMGQMFQKASLFAHFVDDQLHISYTGVSFRFAFEQMIYTSHLLADAEDHLQRMRRCTHTTGKGTTS